MADPSGRGWRVLVLEREPRGDLASTVSLIAEAHAVLNEDDLLGRIHRERVDAVVFDAMIPNLNSVGLISELKARQKATRFVPILVGVDRNEVLLREQVIDAGATDLIDLPIQVNEARARLEHLLKARSWHAKLAESGATLDRERRETTAARQELMPLNLPAVTGWEFAARVRHLGRFTGDAYDVFQVTPDRIAVSVADALGSDVVSLIRLAMVRAWVRSAARRAECVSEVLAELNQLMIETFGDEGRFVTLYVGFLNPATAEIQQACAGFVEPVLWGAAADSQLSPKMEGGPPLGVTRDAIYRESSLVLPEGSRLILGTHGLQRERQSPGSMADRVAAGADMTATEMADTLAEKEPHPSSRRSSGIRDVTFLVVQRVAAVTASIG